MPQTIIQIDEFKHIVDENGRPYLDDLGNMIKIYPAEISVYKKLGIIIQPREPKES